MKLAERDEKKKSERIPEIFPLDATTVVARLYDVGHGVGFKPGMDIPLNDLENFIRALRSRPGAKVRFDEAIVKVKHEEKRVQVWENRETTEKLIDLEDELKEIWEYTREDRRIQNSRWRELESRLNVLSEQRVVYAAKSDPKAFRDELRTGMMGIEWITLVLVKEDPECLHVTVFYDEQTPDYGQLERTVFDTFHEILDGFPDVPTDILALLYDSSRLLPPDSQLILDNRPEVFSN